MGVYQSFDAAVLRIEADAAETAAVLRDLIDQCREIERRRRRALGQVQWATGALFCLVGGVLSQSNNQSLGNRGEVEFDGEINVFTGFDATGRPTVERRRDPGPGRGRNRREVVRFRAPNNDLDIGSLGLALCRHGEGMKRKGRTPDGR